MGFISRTGHPLITYAGYCRLLSRLSRLCPPSVQQGWQFSWQSSSPRGLGIKITFSSSFCAAYPGLGGRGNSLSWEIQRLFWPATSTNSSSGDNYISLNQPRDIMKHLPRETSRSVPTRCLNHINWVLSTWRRSNVNLSLSRMSEFFYGLVKKKKWCHHRG